MKLRHGSVYTAVLLVASLNLSSEALVCYECDSRTNSDCSDPFGSVPMETCRGASCFKMWIRYEDTLVTTRYCDGIELTYDHCGYSSKSGVEVASCGCTDSFCNDAKELGPTVRLLGLTTLLAICVTAWNYHGW